MASEHTVPAGFGPWSDRLLAVFLVAGTLAVFSQAFLRAWISPEIAATVVSVLMAFMFGALGGLIVFSWRMVRCSPGGRD